MIPTGGPFDTLDWVTELGQKALLRSREHAQRMLEDLNKPFVEKDRVGSTVSVKTPANILVDKGENID